MLERMRQWFGRSRRARVLLAEDDADMRELLALALRVDGHEIIEAPDGRRLLAYVQAAVVDGEKTPPPDIIVSDVCMPGYSGLEILTALREAEIDLPVVLISAYTDEKMRQQAFELGAVMLDKPLELDNLRETIKLLVR